MKITFKDIEFVLLDMDGTLLDRSFDDFFWEKLLPDHYGRARGLDREQSREELLRRYRQREGSLAWTDIDFWSKELEIDIEGLKDEQKHLIVMHPDVEKFLGYVASRGLKVVLVTNAHPKVLALKLSRTNLEEYLDRTVCSQEMGVAKEEILFWKRLETVLGPGYAEHSILVDDTERVLLTARDYGVRFNVFRWYGNSDFPAAPSPRFISIGSLEELLRSELWR